MMIHSSHKGPLGIDHIKVIPIATFLNIRIQLTPSLLFSNLAQCSRDNHIHTITFTVTPPLLIA